MEQKAEKKKKELPKVCVCGRAAVVVRYRGKKMISCPDPAKCKRNLRTLWYGSEEAAVVAWNKMVEVVHK